MTSPLLTLKQPHHRVRALFHGHLIADTEHAVILHQDGLPAEVYFPRDDVEMAVLTRADDSAFCPVKGDARYYTLMRDREIIEQAAWSYEGPLPTAEALRDLIAFDRRWVQIEGESPDKLWDAQAEKMSDYIRHTDSGAGASQGRPWAPNVSRPGEDSLEYDDDRG